MGDESYCGCEVCGCEEENDCEEDCDSCECQSSGLYAGEDYDDSYRDEPPYQESGPAAFSSIPLGDSSPSWLPQAPAPRRRWL